jgi:hypothetical protein
MRQAEETLSSWDELLYIDLIYNRESKETDAIETAAVCVLFYLASSIRTGARCDTNLLFFSFRCLAKDISLGQGNHSSVVAPFLLRPWQLNGGNEALHLRILVDT